MKLTPSAAIENQHTIYHAIEILLKGPEVALPEGATFKNKDGHIRNTARIKWWTPNHFETKEQMHLGEELQDDHKLATMPTANEHHYLHINKLIFFGHYWLNDKNPAPLSDNYACLDYSIAKAGKLVAYQWKGEKN